MMDKHGTVWVANTTLKAIASCETQAALKYALGKTIIEDQHKLEAGLAYHDVLADFLRGVDPTLCLRKFELLYREYSEDHKLDRKGTSDNPNPFYGVSWTNASAILGEWFETHPLVGFPFLVNPKLVEVPFQLPLDDECVCGHWEAEHRIGGCRFRSQCGCVEYAPRFIFWGRIDAVVQSNHDNGIYVLDHKTTGRLTSWRAEAFRMDSQMSGYTWAAEQSLGQKLAGIYVNAIELSQLPSDPVRKCKVHGNVVYAECGPMHMKTELMIFTRTPTQLEKWRSDAMTLAWRYREVLRRVKSVPDLTLMTMAGTFHGACSFCDFKPFCQGEQQVPGMLVERPRYLPPTQEGQ